MPKGELNKEQFIDPAMYKFYFEILGATFDYGEPYTDEFSGVLVTDAIDLNGQSRRIKFHWILTESDKVDNILKHYN